MLTYVPTRHHISRPKVMVCPFGERDLSRDVCYSGNGINKCTYFIRYDWSHIHYGCVACNHPIIDKHVQLTFDFESYE